MKCSRVTGRALLAAKRPALLTALAAALSLALVSSGSTAALRIADDAPRAALWQRIYDGLPAYWKTRQTVVVDEVTDGQMDRLVAADEGQGPRSEADDDSIVDGYYQSGTPDDPPTITLRRSLRGDAAGLVFAHEYGHYVWDSRLSQAQRSQYNRIWERRRRAHGLVTSYARDSVEEGFAEAFSFYVLRPASLRKRDPESMHFFRAIGS